MIWWYYGAVVGAAPVFGYNGGTCCSPAHIVEVLRVFLAVSLLPAASVLTCAPIFVKNSWCAIENMVLYDSEQSFNTKAGQMISQFGPSRLVVERNVHCHGAS